MDDNNKDTLTGGGFGALLGGAVGGPPGAALGGLAGALLWGHERKHNKTLRETYYQIYEATDGEATHHVDHIEPKGAVRRWNPERYTGRLRCPRPHLYRSGISEPDRGS